MEFIALVRSLQYLLQIRSDITYAMNQISQFSKELHWIGAKRILRYIKGTHGLKFTKSSHPKLQAYCHADFAGDLDIRKYTT